MLDLGVLGERAKTALESRGLATSFSPESLGQMRQLGGPAPILEPHVRDLRGLDWASIDNADTRDIDQLAHAEELGEGKTRLRVAIADVAGSIPKDSPLDQDAQRNTVTVYTTGWIFPMLPEELSTDWTSLGPGVDRRALVTELSIDPDGKVTSSHIYEAAVNNKAKCDYVSVSNGLEGMPEQIRLQVETGRRLAKAAEARGALEFEADRVLPVVENGRLVDLVEEEKNIASEAVAHQMIATNIANAKFLHERGYPVLQRVVEAPERWDRMRELAGDALPPRPDAPALSRFLREFKQRDPEHYPAMSKSMLKLMGGGDYKVTRPGEPLKGHFGQGVPGGKIGYVHSTAPNRRFPDVIIQRLLKAALRREPCPYTLEELQTLADRCNKQESAAKSAEREVRKAAVADYLTSQIGQQFQAFVTGRNERKGTFVKVLDPPIEGKLVSGFEGLDVGSQVKVELTRVDPEKGYIDFTSLPNR